MITSELAKANFGDSECLVPAIKLLPLKGVSRVKNWETVDYYHVLLKRHEIIYANGAPTETLYLGDMILYHMPRDSFEEIIEIFPEIMNTPVLFARQIAEGTFIKSLVKEMREKYNRFI